MRLLTKTEPEMNVTNEKNYQKPNLKSFHWVNREKKIKSQSHNFKSAKN